ncbi:hypothetical protein EOT10_17375 [Streptomyces antnestii]|uniref:Uncharacterized protein n=1 Tax=Streptomyces antnestii TaxID=2494256 RepID=A0A437PNW0_9ACTN|nr:hypothetical protein [Streptomyces sp. San01]RVU23829.1 hypothetical protein EOT10_17375 [Streptomyces sp. San01]
MSTAQHLATIDLLRSREFPAEHGRSDAGAGGPGYHIAELATRDRPGDDGDDEGYGDAAGAQEQTVADRDGLSAVLTERWGEPQWFSLWSVSLRAVEGGEDIPEPWAGLSAYVPDVQVWQADGRWIVLGIPLGAEDLPFRLVAAITDVDPP